MVVADLIDRKTQEDYELLPEMWALLYLHPTAMLLPVCRASHMLYYHARAMRLRAHAGL